nr:metal ABC transporter permease [Propionicicella superfundia]
MDILMLPFMQRALLAAFAMGLIAPAIGTFIVQRRLALLGDGLGHVAIAGVGLALATGSAPLPLAIIVSVVGAVGVELLRQYGKASGDVGLAILFYGGLALGVLLAGVAGQGAGGLSQYLFGSLLTVTPSDLWIILGLGFLVLVPAIGLAPQIFALAADEDHARTLGLPVRLYSILLVVLAAITVALSMRTVGLLLVSALMVVPVAAANNMARSYRGAIGMSLVLGVLASVGGVLGSYWLNAAPGATIVIMAIAFFALSWPVGTLLARRRAPVREIAEPEELPHTTTPVPHPHVHSDTCGHVMVHHDDHVDFIHDGHRHAAHLDHYDEH